ncbi:MAG TPA: hypothetical protein VME01_12010, partial [Solirubrobacteraceae bacterium]|nr:hypothetical protein [Solirubrobacteraceae bacterium]
PQTEQVDIPVSTAPLTDGQHDLKVVVTDAAQNSSTVLDQTITTANRTAVSSAEPKQRSGAIGSSGASSPPCNGVCDSAPTLVITGPARSAFAGLRDVGRSALALTGRLTAHDGSPIARAQLELIQQASALGQTPRVIETATTSTTGTWSFRVPTGPSRTLTITYREHASESTPAATATYHETVAASVRLRGPRGASIGQRVVFDGSLPGGYIPADGELVAMQIFYSGQWRTIDLVRTTPAGRFAYSYQFAGVPAGNYRFRADVPATSNYPYASNHSAPVTIEVN